jgi:hypothetical protein
MNDIRTIVSSVLFIFFSVGASAEDSGMDRRWIGKSISAPSQYSSANEARAKEFLGEVVRIGRHEITLPNQTVCKLQEPVFEKWHNDMATFGSFGGDWTEIGLQRSSDEFAVVSQLIDCPEKEERLVQLVSQPSKGTWWLNFGRVFVSLH